MGGKRLIAGVIGGLGPAATVDFMQRVLDLTPASTDQQHVRLLVDQNPTVPNRQQAILENGPSPGPVLAAMACGLEQAGADFLVMPCNTAHAYQHDIAAAIRIPFVSIVAATIDAIPGNATTVGVLETPACQRAGLYLSALQSTNRKPLTLDAKDSDALMQVAYAVKGGDCGLRQRETMRGLVDGLVARGAEAIIVACTEIPLVLQATGIAVPFLSTTDALAQMTIAIACGEIPLPATEKQ